MIDKKPSGVKVIIGITTWKLVAILVIIGTFYFTRDMDPAARNVAAGMRDAIIKRFSINMANFDYELGRLIGKFVMPALLAIITLVSVYSRKFWLAIIVIIADLLIGLVHGFPILTLIILIIALTNPSRSYLKNKNNGTLVSENDPTSVE